MNLRIMSSTEGWQFFPNKVCTLFEPYLKPQDYDFLGLFAFILKYSASIIKIIFLSLSSMIISISTDLVLVNQILPDSARC